MLSCDAQNSLGVSNILQLHMTIFEAMKSLVVLVGNSGEQIHDEDD